MRPCNHYIEALDCILASDLPERVYPRALRAHACLLARVDADLLDITESD